MWRSRHRDPFSFLALRQLRILRLKVGYAKESGAIQSRDRLTIVVIFSYTTFNYFLIFYKIFQIKLTKLKKYDSKQISLPQFNKK